MPLLGTPNTEAMVIDPIEPETPTSWVEQFQGAINLGNTALALGDMTPNIPAEPGFNPLPLLTQNELAQKDLFGGAQSIEELEDMRFRETRKRGWEEKLETGPLNPLVVSIISGFADPTNFIPFGTVTRGAGFITNALRTGGGSAAITAGQETILHQSQDSRTIEESALNVVFSTVLSGALGGTIGAIGTRKIPEEGLIEEATQEMLNTPGVRSSPQSVSSAAVPRVAPGDTELSGSLLVAEASKRITKHWALAPGLELQSSKFPTIREMVGKLVETGMYTKGHFKGVTTSGESGAASIQIANYDGPTAVAEGLVKQDWLDAKKAGFKLTQKEFNIRVGQAMFRGDNDMEIPQVAAAAKRYRSMVADPLAKDATNTHIFGEEDLKLPFGETYFPHKWVAKKIMGEVDQKNGRTFRKSLVGYFTKQDGGESDPSEILDAVNQVINKIVNAPQGSLVAMRIPLKRGPMKDRTLKVPTEDFKDWLDFDAVEVFRSHTRTMAGDIVFARTFGSTNAFDELVEQISREGDAEIEALVQKQLEKKTSIKKIEAMKASLKEELTRETNILLDLASNIRGTNRPSAMSDLKGMQRVAKSARDFNYTSMLGNVVLSSIGDIGAVTARHGFARQFGGALHEMVTGFKGIKMTNDDTVMSGAALDLLRDDTIGARYDLGDEFENANVVERTLTGATKAAGKVFGIVYWNTLAKNFTSMLSSTHILNNSLKMAQGKPLNRKDTAIMARLNIDASKAARIAAMAEHWTSSGPITAANLGAWTDQDAARAFRYALLADVNNTIITPNAGDAPLWASNSEVGKLVAQFLKFGSAANQRMLIANMQLRDIQATQGMLATVALGAASLYLKESMTEKGVKDRTPEGWAVEAVNRSGYLSNFYQMDTLIDAGSGHSLQRFAGGDIADRFRGQSLATKLSGVSAGQLENISRAAQGSLEGDFTKQDLHNNRRLIPFQNTIWAGRFFDELEQYSAKEMGLPGPDPLKKKP